MASTAQDTARAAPRPAATNRSSGAESAPDVVGVGAGFAGLYMLHKLRTLGFTVRAIETADDVGGTWYWNRYPGTRWDITTADHTYSFDPELEAAWSWSESGHTHQSPTMVDVVISGEPVRVRMAEALRGFFTPAGAQRAAG
jgi:phytoene dehydrogenase-like protein